MRKLTLLIISLFVTLGVMAQTATLEVSTNVRYPESQYQIKNGNNEWMAASTAPTQNNKGHFAFFAADGENAYKIYSIDRQEWVSYDKSSTSDNCKDFATFVAAQDDANAWKITSATRNEQAVYQIQPYNNDGTVSDRYWNWNGGVGYSYQYDDEKTVGLWKDNAAKDGGSAWVLVDYVETVSSINDFVNGGVYTFITERGWMGSNGNDYVISTAYTQNNIAAADITKTNPNFQWTVYKSSNDCYYLYNIGRGKFMGVESRNNQKVPFVATPAGADLTFKNSNNATYRIMFSTDNAAVVNHSPNHAYGLISWTDGWLNLNDGGSNHKVEKVDIVEEETLATIENLVNEYETELVAQLKTELATAIAKAEAISALRGEGVGKYSYTGYNSFDEVFDEVKAFDADNATIKVLQEKIEVVEGLISWCSLNMPQVGNYYRIQSVATEAYLSSVNHTTKTTRAAYVADADVTTIFKFDDKGLYSYASGQYLVNNSNFLGYGSTESGAIIEFQQANASLDLKGAYCIRLFNTNRWLYAHADNYTDAGGTNNHKNYSFYLEEVTELPVAHINNVGYATLDAAKAAALATTEAVEIVLLAGSDKTIVFPANVTINKNGFTAENLAVAVAKIGDVLYATLAEAAAAAKAGETVVLLKETDETYVLPAGVKLDKNNFNAPNVNEAVAKIGEQVYYTFEDALAAAQAGQTITLVADVTCAEKPVFDNGGVVNVDINGHVFVSSEKARVRCVASADGTVASNNIKFVRGFGWEAYYNANEKFRVFPTLDEAVAYKSGTNAANIYPYENVVQDKDITFCTTGEQTSTALTNDAGYKTSWDLNGYTVLQETAAGNPLESTVLGEFTLLDSSAEKTGKWIAGAYNGNTGGGPAFIVNRADAHLILQGGTISIARNGDVVNTAGLINTNYGTLTVDGATLQCDDTYGVMAWGGKVVVNSGEFVMGEKAVYSVFASKHYADASVEVNTAIDGYLLISSTATATVNAAGVKYVANGTDYVAPAVGEGLVAQGGVVGYPVAKIGDVKYATLEEAFTAATDGATITMLADAAPALTSQSAITKAAVIDLGGNTLTLTEDDLYFGTTTFKNGTIVVDPSVKPSTAVFWMFANQTLTFDAVKVVATGVTGTYLIGLDGNNSDLNLLNGSEILVENTTALDLDIICVNASTGNDIVVENSKVNVSNLDGRVFFRGNYTVKDSEVKLAGITKAGFRIEAGQTLSIEGNSTVTVEGEPRDGGIHLTDVSATYTKAETATVTATVQEVKAAAKIGDKKFATLADALAAANAMTGDVTVEVYGKVEFVDGMELNGSYTSIKFCGKDDEAQITINQTAGGDYLTAHDKTVAFEDLILAKANPAWSGNSGHMGNYFSIQGGTVTYTRCTFLNGACTSGGTATYDDCIFQNASEYGLWVYDDAVVTVNGGTVDSKKGIKVYSEDETSVTSALTVQNATFTENVVSKPAVAVGYAESITLIGNTYNNTTGVLELDSGSDADCEGITFVAEDANGNDISSTIKPVDRSNSNSACGVLVDGKIYTTVTQAAEAVTGSSTVTLLHNSTETVLLPEGSTLNTNGFTAPNVKVEQPLAGEGTEAAPYLINDAADLENFRNKVNAGRDFAGQFVKLAADITLTAEWAPIGNGTRSSKSYAGNSFKGTFDGDNKTISGLKITSTTGEDAAIGLFGVVDGGTVKNLTLAGVNINVANSDLAGGAIGLMLNGATAENITVNGAVTGHDGVGGIVGRLVINGTIKGCTNNAGVTSAYGGIGGIVGKAYYEDGANTALFASIENCTNNGTVTAPMYVGGITGLARANVTGCVNNGAVVGGTQTGGIVGQLIAAGTVTGNENKAKITGKNHLGGIIGDYSQSSAYTYNNVAITSNINRGELAATEQCAAIMGCNNIDGFTAMTATGNLSYYFVEGLELFGNPEDMVIDATNKFVLPIAKVGDNSYYTLAEAAAAAKAGDEIVLLADVEEAGEVTLPEGVKLNGNGKKLTNSGKINLTGVELVNATIDGTGTTYFYNTINFNGANSITSGVNGYPFELVVNKGANLLISRFVLGYGRNITVYGEIEDAHAFDPTGKTPSLKFNSTSGVSVGGTGTGNITAKDAYIEFGSSSWKNSQAVHTWSFENCYISATSLGNNNAPASEDAKWDVTFNNSVVAAKNYIKNGKNTTYSFTNGSVGTTGSLRIDGELNIDATSSVTTTAQQNNKVGEIDEHGGINGTVNVAGTLTIGSTSNTQLEVLGGTVNVEEGATVALGSNTLTLDATSALKSAGNINGAITAAEGASVAISGGSYTQDVTDWCTDGFIVKPNADGTFGVVAKPVAKVGNTEYSSIDEAIANWTNNTTLTLLADVTLSDVVKIKSTEYHVLDLGTYTMTAATGKNAIEITNEGRSSASYALDIKADATNPGGITAASRAVVKTTGKSGVKDRPIIRFYNGVFNASNIIQHSGSNGTNSPQFVFYNGVYNGNISTNRAICIFEGGTFNGRFLMSVDSSSYARIGGGTFKYMDNLYGSALNANKFTIGSAKGVFDRGVYVDDNGNVVVGGAVVTEPGDKFEASSANATGAGSYLQYSSAQDNGLYYTAVEEALADNNNASGSVTVYVEELDMAGIDYKGTIVVPDGGSMTVTNVPATTTIQLSAGASVVAPEGTKVVATDGNVVVENNGKYESKVAVAKVGDAVFASLAEALAVATEGATVTLLNNTTESIAAISNVKFDTAVAGGVTVTNTCGDWINMVNVTVGAGVTLDMPNVYYTNAGVNVIEGTLNAGTLYNANNSKITVQNGGKITTTGMIVNRYHTAADAGIYVYGDGDNSTVEVDCADTIGTYSGTFYAKDAVVKANMLWIDYLKDSTQESDSYSQSKPVFENSILNITKELRFYKDATLTLVASDVTAGTVQIREKATPTVNVDAESSIKATAVQNLAGASINAVRAEDGTVTFVNMVAKIGETTYATLAAAVAAATDGATVTLLDNTTLDAVVTIEMAITVDLNEKTVTGADGAIVFNIKAPTTIKNGTVVGNKGGTSSGLIDIYANLAMDGVTVETSKINALRFKAGDCTATLDNCNITGAFKGYGGSVWAINSGTYKAASTAINDQLNGTAQISGGTFHYTIDNTECASGYSVVDNGDGTYTVKYAPVCFVDTNNNGTLDEGETVYGSLDAIFNTIKEGDVYIVLTGNTAIAGQVDTDADAKYYLNTNVAEGVTVDFDFADDWNYVQKMYVGKGVTLNAPHLLAWTDLEVHGTINTGYLYTTVANVVIAEGAVVNATTGDATVQVKNGATLTVNGELNASILNVWVEGSKLIVSGDNAKVNAKWIDIWDGTPVVNVENGATLAVENIKASRGGSIEVTDATLAATGAIELGHNGESAGKLTESGNSTITGEIKMTATGSTVASDGGLNVTTDIADHKVVFDEENKQYKVVPKEYIAQVGETKYEIIPEAVDAAADGATVKLLADVAMDTKRVTELGTGYVALVNVQGKAVTIDLNGKTVTVDAAAADLADYGLLFAVFHADTDGNLTITDSSNGAGAVNLNVNDAVVYSFFACTTLDFDKTHSGRMTIDGGNYRTVGKLNNSMLYADADEVMTINGGNFHLDGVSTTASTPSMINTGGANTLQTVVNGGTFNVDVLRQYRPFEVKVAETLAVNNNGDGTWSVVPAEAYVIEKFGEIITQAGDTEVKVGYARLADAVAAVAEGETVTMVNDVTYTKETGFVNGTWVDGLVYDGDKNFTVDFAGHTITDNGEINDYLVYLKNTGAKDNEITFKNGKVVVGSTTAAYAAITVGSNSSTHKTTLNLDAMEVVNGNPNAVNNQVLRIRNGATLNLNSGTLVTSNGTSYGVVAEAASVVNINDGAKVVHTNSGTTGGNLVYTAVSGNGTINIYDGAIIESDNYAIHNMTSGNAVINIYGGTITAPVAVHAATNGGAGETATVNITGGTINGEMEEANSASSIIVTGGIFDRPVDEEFCAVNYAPVDNYDGTYGVELTVLDEYVIVDDDYTAYDEQNSKSVGKLTYTRQIPSSGIWQSFYVPFEVPVSMLTDLGYDVAYFLDVHFEVVDGVIDMSVAPDAHVIKVKSGTLKANFPYAIRATSTASLALELVLENVKLYSSNAEDMNYVESSSTVNRFIFGGTYTRAIPSELTGNSSTPCYAVTKKGEFKLMGESAGLPPFRVYMSIVAKDGSPVIYEGAPAESIAIRVIGEENEDGTTSIYDVTVDTGDNVIYDLQGRRVLEPEKGRMYIINGKKVIY